MVPRRKTSGTHELAMVTLFPGVQMVLVISAWVMTIMVKTGTTCIRGANHLRESGWYRRWGIKLMPTVNWVKSGRMSSKDFEMAPKLTTAMGRLVWIVSGVECDPNQKEHLDAGAASV